MQRINPFTRTPGVAGAAFIDMHYADEIIRNFESELSSRYVYKIVGLRGSGKSVEYSKIINRMSEKRGGLYILYLPQVIRYPHWLLCSVRSHL